MRRTPLGDSFLFGLVTFFAAAGLSTVAALVGAVVVALVLGIGFAGETHEAGPLGPQPIQLLLGALVPGQVMILLTALAAALWSGEPMNRRLGLAVPRLRWWQGIVVWVGSGVPFALAIAASRLMPPWDRAAAEDALWGHVPIGLAVAWTVIIGLMPGIGEELLFRGVIQRSFLRSMKPPAAILLTSVLFALLHIEPATVALAFVLGLWFGALAWRTGSVIPGMVLHATFNSGWNAGQFLVRSNDHAARLAPLVLTVAGIVALVAFVWAVRILLRLEPPAELAAESTAERGGPAYPAYPAYPAAPMPRSFQPVYVPPPPPPLVATPVVEPITAPDPPLEIDPS